jgi:hypothetical protein
MALASCGKSAREREQEREKDFDQRMQQLQIDVASSVAHQQQEEARQLNAQTAAQEKAARAASAADRLWQDIANAEDKAGIDGAETLLDARKASLATAIAEARAQPALPPDDRKRLDEGLLSTAADVCKLGQPLKHHGKPPPSTPVSQAAKYQQLCDTFRQTVR